MALKRNPWLVRSVLIVAVGALLAVSILPFVAGRNEPPAATAPTQQTPEAEEALDPEALKLQLQARVEAYEEILAREPNNQTVTQDLVQTLEALVYTQGQLEGLQGSLEPLERLVNLRPEVPTYRVLLGQAKQELGDLDGATQDFREVLTQNPGDIQALQAFAALLVEQGRPQAAIGLLEDTLETASQANEVTPGTIDVMSVKFLLAQFYAEDGQSENALQLYDDVIDARAGDFRPFLAKALVLQEAGRGEEAAPLFDQAEEMAPAEFKDQVRQMAALSTGEGIEAPPADSAEESGSPDEATESPSEAGDTAE